MQPKTFEEAFKDWMRDSHDHNIAPPGRNDLATANYLVLYFTGFMEGPTSMRDGLAYSPISRVANSIEEMEQFLRLRWLTHDLFLYQMIYHPAVPQPEMDLVTFEPVFNPRQYPQFSEPYWKLRFCEIEKPGRKIYNVR